jgi:hypothetical protein
VRLAPPLLAASIAAVAAAPTAAPGGAPAPAPLVVKASPVARPCVVAAAAALGSAGARVTVQAADVGPVDSAGGADVVVAAEEELTRVIEGGASMPDVEAELGRIPWVLVAPAGSPAPDVHGLVRSTASVRVPRGVIARHARASLEGVAPERVRSVRADAAAVAPQPGELALVPLSLAGRGSVAVTDVPPVLVVAVGVRASAHPDAARAFVEALASGPGNAAFRACGREASR